MHLNPLNVWTWWTFWTIFQNICTFVEFSFKFLREVTVRISTHVEGNTLTEGCRNWHDSINLLETCNPSILCCKNHVLKINIILLKSNFFPFFSSHKIHWGNLFSVWRNFSTWPRFSLCSSSLVYPFFKAHVLQNNLWGSERKSEIEKLL